MLTLDVRLGWVVRVRPDHLAAHLETFVKMRPTIDALRACNRFGQGSGAHITKLPPELIDRIETFVLEPERKKARAVWEQRAKCYSGTCKPIQHYNRKEILGLWHVVNGIGNQTCKECSSRSGTSGPSSRCTIYSRRPSAYEMRYVNKELTFGEDFSFDLQYEGDTGPCGLLIEAWEERHRERRDSWWLKLGIDGVSAPHTLANLPLLKTIFGLEVVASTVQRPIDSDDPKYPEQKAVRDTVTYLMLGAGERAQSKLLKTFYGEYIEGDEEVISEVLEFDSGPPVETSRAFDLTIPARPSEASLRRFPRALKMLGLQAMEMGDSTELGQRDSNKPKEAEAPSADASRPVFKLLTRHADNGDLIG